MARRVLISLDPEAGVHRIRNYAEALSRAIPEIGGCLPMEEADRARDRLVITAIPARKLKRVLAFAAQLLRDHHLDTEATLEACADQGTGLTSAVPSSTTGLQKTTV